MLAKTASGISGISIAAPPVTVAMPLDKVTASGDPSPKWWSLRPSTVPVLELGRMTLLMVRPGVNPSGESSTTVVVVMKWATMVPNRSSPVK